MYVFTTDVLENMIVNDEMWYWDQQAMPMPISDCSLMDC